MPVIYDEFKLPNHCLINKPIPKNVFLEYGKMTEIKKERFEKYFNSAVLVYSIKNTDLNLPPLNYKKMDYNELQIIEVSVKTTKIPYLTLLSFAQDIAQAISYPIILVLKYGLLYRLFAFKTHKGVLDDFQSIVEDKKCTSWFKYDVKTLPTTERKILHNTMCYFRLSKNIYDLCNNLMLLFEKQFKIHNQSAKIKRQNYYYNGHEEIEKRIKDF